MASIKFVVKDYVRSDGTANVVLRLTHKRKVSYIPTTFYVDPELFNNTTGEVEGSSKNSMFTNLQLAKLKIQYQERIYSLTNINNLSCKALAGKIKNDYTGSGMDFYEYFKTEYSLYLTTQGNKAAYDSTISRFKKFTGDYLLISDITKQLIQNYSRHLRKEGLRTNTISFYLRGIRAVCNQIVEDGYRPYDWYPFRGVKIESEETKSRALSLEEFRRLIGHKPTNKYHQRAIDVFLISFMLRGINIKDLFELERCDLSNYYSYRRSKTHGLIVIKKESMFNAIFSKYKTDDSMAFNFSSKFTNHKSITKKTNYHLQQIAKEIKINNSISTYYARHTWAMIAFNECNISKDTIAACLGHKSRNDVTGIYARMNQSEIDKASKIVLTKCFSSK